MVSLKRDDNDVPVLGAVTDNASQTISPILVDPATGRVLVSATGAGAGLNISTPTGTVNGVNTTFTVANIPQAVVIDNLMYFGAGDGYTYSGGTITVNSDRAPVSSIKYFY